MSRPPGLKRLASRLGHWQPDIHTQRVAAPIRILQPFQRFLQTEASSGILLLGAAALALILANSPLAGQYDALLHAEIAISLGNVRLAESVIHWINDGLMALFFLVVGLEIKREVVAGELRSPQRAVLPLVAAIGGILIPAAIYIALNANGPGIRGWGIPMATDIAFSLGVLALAGRGAPVGLRIFLTSFAIADDMAAVLVIALAYTSGISWIALAVAGICFALLVLANRLGLRQLGVYALLGVALWLALLRSGVHATIAGVLVALTIPVRARIDSSEFVHRARAYVDAFAASGYSGVQMLTNEGQQAALEALEESAEQFQVPLQRVEHALHPWVAYGIVPLFALANAGVALDAGFVRSLVEPVTLGIFIGLVVGKPAGILLGAWLATRVRIAALPAGVRWRQMVGVAFLGGIGFTMSLFITDLAFESESLIMQAKAGILLGSLVAGTAGWLILRSSAPPADREESDDETQ
jgi:Na+:H+ antiporter, NhaA family